MAGNRYSKTTHWLRSSILAFFGGPKKPVIEGEIEVGNGSMRVWVVLDDDRLRDLARLAAYILVEPNAEVRGHAFWHWQNPEREYPCDSCSDAVKQATSKWAKRINEQPLSRSKATEVTDGR